MFPSSVSNAAPTRKFEYGTCAFSCAFFARSINVSFMKTTPLIIIAIHIQLIFLYLDIFSCEHLDNNYVMQLLLCFLLLHQLVLDVSPLFVAGLDNLFFLPKSPPYHISD